MASLMTPRSEVLPHTHWERELGTNVPHVPQSCVGIGSSSLDFGDSSLNRPNP